LHPWDFFGLPPSRIRSSSNCPCRVQHRCYRITRGPHSGLQPLARYGQNGWEIVVGRKNWLFSDTVGGAKASANLYSLIETAKVWGVEPYQYLRYIFARLPLAKTVDDYDALLPWRLHLKNS
jgi:hypothetical protein